MVNTGIPQSIVCMHASAPTVFAKQEQFHFIRTLHIRSTLPQFYFTAESIMHKAPGTVRKMAGTIKRLILLLPIATSPDTLDLTIVTGADSSHFKSLTQLLQSLELHESGTNTVVYDLGLTSQEASALRKQFSSTHIKAFDYSKYPEYFDIRKQAGQYAWKPVIVNEIMNEYKTAVCWMDAGNVVTGKLKWLRKTLNSKGFYSPYSSGTIGQWTHPKTLQYMNVQRELLAKRNLNGACVAVNYENRNAFDLVKRWHDCALVKECIAPDGSSRANHRQDQSVLSVLAHQSGLVKGLPPFPLGFLTHRDIDDHRDHTHG